MTRALSKNVSFYFNHPYQNLISVRTQLSKVSLNRKITRINL